MDSDSGPDIKTARWLTLPDVVKRETVRLVEQSLNLRGQQIADRWAAASPNSMREMEAGGTLITSLRNQETIENQTISDARVSGRYQDLPDSDILALYEIPPLPEWLPSLAKDYNKRVFGNSFPTWILHAGVAVRPAFRPDGTRMEAFDAVSKTWQPTSVTYGEYMDARSLTDAELAAIAPYTDPSTSYRSILTE